MPVAKFQLPDGRVARFEVPEDTTPEQAQAMIGPYIRNIYRATPKSSSISQFDVPPIDTTGQKIYKAARPFVAPLLEAGGAIAGGTAGARISPVASLVGAGLGYAGAKELEEIADVGMGVKAPRKGLTKITEPAINIAQGAAYDAGGRLVAQGLVKGVGEVIDLANLPAKKAVDIVKQAAGQDLESVIKLLKNAPADEPVAQTISKINSPTLQALVDRMLRRDPRYVNALTESQNTASVNALSKLAGGETSTVVRQTAEQAKKQLNKELIPVLENELAKVNAVNTVISAGEKLARQSSSYSKLAADEVAKVRHYASAQQRAIEIGSNKFKPLGQPRIPLRYTYEGDLAKFADKLMDKAAKGSLEFGEVSRLAKSASDEVASLGLQPLKTENIVSKITSQLTNPKYAANDKVHKTLNNVINDITNWTNNKGVINAHALDAIRKNSVNAAVRELLPQGTTKQQSQLAGKLTAKVNPLIVEAIEQAGGKGYGKYLADYSKGMQQIAEQKLAGKALELYNQNKDAFVKLVEGNSPKEVEKILGYGKYDIAKEVSENTMNVLREEADKIIQNTKIKTQIEGAQDALKEVLSDHIVKLRLPSLINPWISATNKTLQEIESRIDRKILQKLTESFKSTKGTVDLLTTLPASERIKVLKILDDVSTSRSSVPAATAISVKNNLNGSENLNSLNRQPIRVINQ